MAASTDRIKPFGTGIKLAMCTLICMSVLGIVHVATKNTIADAQLRKQSRLLKEILAETAYDNLPETDMVSVNDPLLGDNNTHTVWRARQQEKPVAVVIETSAPYGYNGPITLLVGISLDGTITGVRVVAHRETPGLGDAIELSRSDWVKHFDQQSLALLPAEQWRVKKEGGDFDQFTGATITPRAIVSAVHNTLLFYRQHQEVLF